MAQSGSFNEGCAEDPGSLLMSMLEYWSLKFLECMPEILPDKIVNLIFLCIFQSNWICKLVYKQFHYQWRGSSVSVWVSVSDK